jgi:Plasmid replication region DNA-binding N-term
MNASSGTTYEQVASIVDALLDDGLEPSRKKVRAALGNRGSFQTIGRLIDQRLTERGLPPVRGIVEEDEVAEEAEDVQTYVPPEPDASAVMLHLDSLRGETAYRCTVSHLQAFAAAYRALIPGVDVTARWLFQQSEASHGETLGNAALWLIMSREGEIAVRRSEHVLAQLVTQAAPKNVTE